MFWGLIMEPNKRYTQTVERPFHVSKATLDISTSDDEPVQVMLCYEGRNYLLCNLSKKQNCQATLDLNFEEGTKISFTSNGSGHVHLTGYLIPEDDMDDLDEMDEQEDEEEDEEEVPQLVGKQLKRKASDKNDDRAMKKYKEIAASFSQNGQDDSSDSDDAIEEEEDDEEGGMELEFEDDDDDEDEDVDDEEVEEEDDDDDEEDDEEEEEEEEKVEVKPKGKQNQQQKNQKQQKDAKDKAVVVNGKDTNQQKKNKKEQQQDKQDKQAKPTQEVKPEVKQQQQVPKKQVLGGGIIIEDLKVGTGAPAVKGKFISVYYIGKLKNGKKFDATQSGKGFKFRLGGGEVIKGWDIGIVGMKIGGKRRVTVPPAMGYGKKGSPPVIPGNSVLIFDVELKEVH